MIAKGASRNNPRQLAVYLMRVERYDTGEPVALLEFQSGWAKEMRFEKSPEGVWQMASPLVLQKMAAGLIEGFRDWQLLTEGTRQGRDGLYHAEISPEAHESAAMTPEQWKRAADILGEELGLQRQPRALVLHGGTDGRNHLHVVWARTDVDTMKVVSDHNNYLANERASKRMELEFGHDFVPGKHSKRDRERQPEFPRQKLTQDEDQWQKRTGLSVEDREAEIAALHTAADSPQAFKAALEDAGYLLAKGKRGYIVVDQLGGHSVLSRNIGLKKKDTEAFMAGIELDKLPTIEEAKALQKEARQREKSNASEDEKPAPEVAQPEAKPVEKAPEGLLPIDLTLYAPKPAASKFLSPELAQKLDQPAAPPPPAAPEAKPFDYELYANYNRKPAPPVPVVEAPAPVPVPPPAPQPPQQPMAPQDAALEALKKAIVERQAEDARTWAEDNAHQLQRLENTLAAVNAGKAKDFEAIQAGERAALKRRHQNEQRAGLKGFLDAVQGKVNPALAAGKAEQQRREVEQLQTRQVRERKDYLALIAQTKQLEIENLRDRLALQRSDRERQQEEETERYIREYHEAKRIADDLEAQRIHEEIEKNDSLREGPPPPRLGK